MFSPKKSQEELRQTPIAELQNARFPRFNGEDQRKLMKTYMNGYFHELEKTRENLEKKPNPTMWQRFKSWIAC